MCEQKKPHKHAAIIKAWADGAEIEVRLSNEDVWKPTHSPVWNPFYEYRVKPQPHPQQDLVDAVRRGEWRGIQVKWSDDEWVDIDGPLAIIVSRNNAQLRRRHKWQKEIDAQAAGKAVQYLPPGSAFWHDSLTWKFNGSGEYRIKPEEVVKYLVIWEANPGVYFDAPVEGWRLGGGTQLKLTFEDRKLIKAEVL